MQYPLLLRTDRWTGLEARLYRTLPRATQDDSLVSKLTLEHVDEIVPPTLMSDAHASPDCNRFRVVNVGHNCVDLCENPQVVPTSLSRSSGAPAHVGNHLVEMLPKSAIIASKRYSVRNGRPGGLMGFSVFLPGETLGVSSVPLDWMPLDALERQPLEPAQSYADKLRPLQGEPPGP